MMLSAAYASFNMLLAIMRLCRHVLLCIISLRTVVGCIHCYKSYWNYWSSWNRCAKMTAMNWYCLQVATITAVWPAATATSTGFHLFVKSAASNMKSSLPPSWEQGRRYFRCAVSAWFCSKYIRKSEFQRHANAWKPLSFRRAVCYFSDNMLCLSLWSNMIWFWQYRPTHGNSC